ncbi:PEP-CTERM/exosortase system-associated acyltransferase [Gloeothece verrucosa]|uniref:PEP-CTERM/exosortase system-associated acyltransferase n=1 Tax=Gloeothece verrucosa (strain PCC 7822) TaxID=497965 RepID=E0UH33_GLOV7|nr:PEP-CTERM/exosortase system-associated acyltransferase [Gloeothece verrucosa]ADN15632.1 conserved hypothetical protein [Gloeothece verrucosa PCC 7822]
MDSNIDLGDYFDNFFSVTVANTEFLKEQVYKIRYQVYCQELHYEAEENFPDQKERDPYDDRSIHILLKHKPTSTYMGCVRAVLGDSTQPDAPFPFENICQHNFDFSQQPRRNFFEISRLAVISQFRRRAGEENSSCGLSFFNTQPPEGIEEKRTASLIPMSLYLACTSIAVQLKIDAFTLMEARLQRHLRWSGIPCDQMGNFVEFHGKRGPFLLKQQEVMTSMKSDTRQLYNHIHAQISQSLPYLPQKVSEKIPQLSYSESFQLLKTA